MYFTILCLYFQTAKFSFNISHILKDCNSKLSIIVICILVILSSQFYKVITASINDFILSEFSIIFKLVLRSILQHDKFNSTKELGKPFEVCSLKKELKKLPLKSNLSDDFGKRDYIKLLPDNTYTYKLKDILTMIDSLL